MTTRPKRNFKDRRCEISKRLGVAGTHEIPEYTVWVQMRRRCRRAEPDKWKNYGAKGIKVCARWDESFDNFFADMGRRPTPKHTIDRIDNRGNYEPANCRWATQVEQQNNRSSNCIVEYRGASMTFANAVRAAGCIVSRDTALARVQLPRSEYARAA